MQHLTRSRDKTKVIIIAGVAAAMSDCRTAERREMTRPPPCQVDPQSFSQYLWQISVVLTETIMAMADNLVGGWVVYLKLWDSLKNPSETWRF